MMGLISGGGEGAGGMPMNDDLSIVRETSIELNVRT